MSHISYTEPLLLPHSEDMTTAWFVYFEITNELTGDTARKQFRGGINYYKTKDERRRVGNALKKFWSERLRDGLYNPFGNSSTPIDAPPKTIAEAIQAVMVIKKKSLKPKSYRGYHDSANLLLRWINERKLTNMRTRDFNNKVAQAFMDETLGAKNYAGKTYNNHVALLHAIFALMCEENRQWMPKNPFAGMRTLPEDIGKYTAYTDEERKQLADYFFRNDIRMYYAINFVFHTFIRRTELTELQVSQVRWDNDVIKVNASETKNRTQDSVTVTKGLREIMLSMSLENAPAHYYIFGKHLLTTESKCNRPDWISDRHKDLKNAMIDEMKAKGIPCTLRKDDDKTFYSWKHTGVIAYYNATKDVYAIMRQCRHHDISVTMLYLRALGLMPNIPIYNADVTL